jgi:hypothetical protein
LWHFSKRAGNAYCRFFELPLKYIITGI